MKLHALNLTLAMTQSHDDARVGLRGDLQTGGQGFAFYDQRMVTAGRKRRRKTSEDRLAIVPYLRRLAVNYSRGADNPSAKCLANRLVAQANSENRKTSRETINQRETNAGIVRTPRSRRNQNAVGKF